MSTDWSAARAETRSEWGERAGRCWSSWRPVEIAIMALGFMVYWPIGLAMIGFKIWQKTTGYKGDLGTLAREGWSAARDDGRWSGWGARCRAHGHRAAAGAWRMRRTGNTAFDDWRDAELARLEEERKKLERAERDFADYIDNLRRARDREEFDRFMRERNASGPSGPSGQGSGPSA